MGQLAGNHFLSVVEGHEHLVTLGVKCLWEGAQEIVFDWEGSSNTANPRAGTP